MPGTSSLRSDGRRGRRAQGEIGADPLVVGLLQRLPTASHCSAPPRSSHTLNFALPILARAEIPERLVGAAFVVPTDPSADSPPRLDEARERMLPHALFLQAPEEAFNHAVLLRGVRCDELLAQSGSADTPCGTDGSGRSARCRCAAPECSRRDGVSRSDQCRLPRAPAPLPSRGPAERTHGFSGKLQSPLHRQVYGRLGRREARGRYGEGRLREEQRA